MFLLKLFYFLKGYVIIDVLEEKGGRLLTAAKRHNIRLWNVTPSQCCCYIADLKQLVKIAEDTYIKIKSTRCISFFEFLQRSAGGILVGGIILCLFLIISARYVWRIEVNGCNSDTAERVLAALEEQGLSVGVKKSSLPDGNTLRDSIIYSIDGINHAWVNFDGISARVEVSYSPAHEPITGNNTPCNITAAHSGIVVAVSATSGRKCTAVGATVSEGDILISGAMPGGTLTAPYMVAAEGEVLAQTVHTSSCTVPLTKTYTKDTGEEFLRRSLRIFDLEIPLSLKKAPPFEQYRVEKSTPPVGLCTYRYISTETVTEQISTEAAVAEARDSLSEQLAHTLANVARKTSEQLIYTELGGFVKVTLTMNFIENIGTATPIEAWQMEELTDDKTN